MGVAQLAEGEVCAGTKVSRPIERVCIHLEPYGEEKEATSKISKQTHDPIQNSLNEDMWTGRVSLSTSPYEIQKPIQEEKKWHPPPRLSL